jgi:hypothetical protein
MSPGAEPTRTLHPTTGQPFEGLRDKFARGLKNLPRQACTNHFYPPPTTYADLRLTVVTQGDW